MRDGGFPSTTTTRLTTELTGVTSPFLNTWHCVATRHHRGEDITLHGNTKGKRADIEEEEIGSFGGGGLAREYTSLNSGTVGDSLIRVDALLELLAIEEVAEQLLDARDTSRTTDKHDLVDLGLLNGCILENLSDRVNSTAEGLGV